MIVSSSSPDVVEQAQQAVGREVHRRAAVVGLEVRRRAGEHAARACSTRATSATSSCGRSTCSSTCLEKTTSTLASSNGSATPSKIRSSTSGRVSYSRVADLDADPAHGRIGGAERVDRVAAPAAEVDDGRAGARGEQGRDQVAPRAPAPTSASGSPVAAGCGDRHPAGGDRTCALNTRSVRVVLRVVLGRRAGRPRAVGVGAPPRAAARPRREPGERVLDLGCGAGRFLTALREAGADPVGVEIAEAAARAGARDARRRRAAARARRLAPVRPRRVRPRVVLGGARAHPGRRHALLRGAPRAQARRPRCCSPCPYHGRLQAAAIALTRFDAHFDPLGQHVRFFTRRSLATHARRTRASTRCAIRAAAGCSSRALAAASRRGCAATRRRRRSMLCGELRIEVVGGLERAQRALRVVERVEPQPAEPAPGLRVGGLEVDRLLERARGLRRCGPAACSIAASSNSGSTASGLRSCAIWAIDAAAGSCARVERVAARRPARARSAPAAARSRPRSGRSASTTARGGRRARPRRRRRAGLRRPGAAARAASRARRPSPRRAAPGRRCRGRTTSSRSPSARRRRSRRRRAWRARRARRPTAGRGRARRSADRPRRGRQPRAAPRAATAPSPTQPRSASVCTT